MFKCLKLWSFDTITISSIISTFTLQIIVYPFLSRVLDNVEYGYVLTVMGVINVLGVSIGSSLNNSRLLRDIYYQKHNEFGDYNVIFTILALITSATVWIITFQIIKEPFTQSLNYAMLTFLIAFKSYYSVSFRLRIDYRKIVYSNIAVAIGYLLGMILVQFTNNWAHVFIVGELTATVFIYFNSFVISEKFRVTKLMKDSLRNYSLLITAYFISNAMSYMDRFLIFPILGAPSVSIFTVASYLGKTLGIIMGPISSVLLTYNVKEITFSLKNFYTQFLFLIMISTASFLGIVFIGEPLLEILYPSLVEEALPYLGLASLSAIIGIIGSLIHPYILAYTHSKWQLIIQILYIFFYLTFTIIGMSGYGLLGFCYAVVLANTLKVLLMIIIITVKGKSRIETI